MSVLHILTALRCEAQPLIEALKLQPAANQPSEAKKPRHFVGDGIDLTIAGVGQQPMRAAVQWLQTTITTTTPTAAWLNVGIAGHPSLPLGSLRFAHQLSSEDTKKRLYPQFTGKPPGATERVHTVNQADLSYAQGCMVEMEAFAFFEQARKTATAEVIGVAKVVSDNRENAPEQITKQHVEELIQRQLDPILAFATHLQQTAHDLSQLAADPAHFAALQSGHHFTVTQTHQLRDLLRRMSLLDSNWSPAALTESGDARTLLAALRSALEAQVWS